MRIWYVDELNAFAVKEAPRVRRFAAEGICGPCLRRPRRFCLSRRCFAHPREHIFVSHDVLAARSSASAASDELGSSLDLLVTACIRSESVCINDDANGHGRSLRSGIHSRSEFLQDLQDLVGHCGFAGIHEEDPIRTYRCRDVSTRTEDCVDVAVNRFHIELWCRCRAGAQYHLASR